MLRNRNITSINLTNQGQINDDSLDLLVNVPNLNFISFGSTQITENGIERFKDSMFINGISMIKIGSTLKKKT